MIYKNTSGQKIGVFAYTASTGAAKTGDAAQITCYESIGFAAADQLDDANPIELDATNMPGWYVFDLTQAETNGEVLIFAPKSSTSGVVLDQIQVVTEASLPQTGDAYAVVAHTDYGNAKLVRSTTPANTLTVDASHQALALTNAVTNDAITAAAIANGAIDAATFAAGAIDAAAIADNAIDNGALAADAISAAKIAADVTTELQSGLATSAELAKVPKSDSNVTWNATALASINAEVDTALNTAIPGSPTANSINERIAAIDDLTQAGGGGDLAAIKGYVDDIGIAGAGLTAVPWNAAWDAEVESEATDALNAYDPPTNTEFEARTLPSADYTVVGDLPSEPDNATIAAILEDTGTTLPNALAALHDFDPAADVVAHVTLVDTTTANTDMLTVADIIAGITEGTLDLQEILRIILAAVAGKASGGGTATIKFRDQADTLDRITATVDANGNRTAVTVDGS